MSFKGGFYGGVLRVGSYTMLNTSISFLSSIATSRLLLPSEFGTLALITVFSGFVAFFKDCGISYLIIREDYSQTRLNELHNFSVFLGFLLFLSMCLLAYPISMFYATNELLFPTIGISLVLLLESFSIVPLAILRKNFKYNQIGTVQTVALVGNIALTITLAILGFSYWSLVFGQWTSAIIQYILFKRIVVINFEAFNFHRLGQIFNEVKPMVARIAGTRFITYWASNADNLMVGKFYGSSDLGIYSRAYQFLNMQMNLIAGTFNSTLLPSLKNIQTDRQKLKFEYSEMLNLMTLVIFPIMIMLVFFSETIVSILWGNNWLAVAKISPYFGVMAMLFLPISTLGSAYIITVNERLLFKSGLTTSILTVIIILIGVYISLETMVFLLSLGYIVIITPIHLFFSFKADLFSFNQLKRNWFPQIFLLGVLILSIYYSLFYLKLLTVLIFFAYMLFLTFRQLRSAVWWVRTKI
jgi:teichuronic acid exporter